MLTADGLLDLLSLCILVILGNVLDFRTYSAPNQGEYEPADKDQALLMSKFDHNGISSNERMAICHARGVALHIIKWVRDCCVVKSPGSEIVDDLPSIYLVRVLNALLQYQKIAEEEGIKGAPHCSSRLLSAQVENVVECDPLVQKRWDQRATYPSDILGINAEAGYVISWSSEWQHRRSGFSEGEMHICVLKSGFESHSVDSDTFFLNAGTTPFDRKFMLGERERFNRERQTGASSNLSRRT